MSEWKYRAPYVGAVVVYHADGAWHAAIITDAFYQTFEPNQYASGQSLVVFPARADSYIVEFTEYGFSDGRWHWPDE